MDKNLEEAARQLIAEDPTATENLFEDLDKLWSLVKILTWKIEDAVKCAEKPNQPLETKYQKKVLVDAVKHVEEAKQILEGLDQNKLLNALLETWEEDEEDRAYEAACERQEAYEAGNDDYSDCK